MVVDAIKAVIGMGLLMPLRAADPEAETDRHLTPT